MERAFEQYQTMQEVLENSTRWQQWKAILKLDEWMSLQQEERDEPLPSDVYAWARQQTQTASQAQAAQPTTPSALVLWRHCLGTIRERWESQRLSLEQSLQELIHPKQAVRYRGTLSPVAVFSEVPVTMQEDRCSFTLQQHHVYAFTTYLPTQGYLAVLQVEESNEQINHALLYPQHTTHLEPMGPGTVQLFRTQFDVLGQTQFLLLFSEVPFSTLAPTQWEQVGTSWTWDDSMKVRLAHYLLTHSDVLTPFLMQVHVTEEGPA
ncbi:MAG: hypothetical protein EP343_11290 [Deltaproteobacteria bacterium]|nr:MAG: hypothetical protein EP343_11290 [Deltaproteobacteria bacterium]